MNGIKMSDCKFYVDEEARTVICVISDTQDMVEDFIMTNFCFPDIDVRFSMSYRWIAKQLKMPHSFMGKAVCSPEDEWNEETGRLIAYSRAKDKCYKSFFKRANRFIQTVDKHLNDMITIFNDFGMKLEDRRVELQKRIDESMGFSIEE